MVSIWTVRWLFLRIFLTLLLLIGVGAAFYDYVERTATEDLLVEQESRNLQLKEEFFLRNLERIIADTYYLAHQKALKEFLNNPKYKRELVEEYVLFADSRKLYNQLRIINQAGMEEIRVNYTQDGVVVVPDQSLQFKGNRDYFKYSSTLSPNSLYLSALEPNYEFGQIEVPIVPVIRGAIPLQDSQGKLKGVLVTNSPMREPLMQLSNHYSREGAEFMLLSKNGFWHAGPERFPLFGSEFSDSQRKNFQYYYPREWKLIELSEVGSIMHHEGLFVFRKLNSMRIAAGFKFANELKVQVNPENSWVFISFLPNDLYLGIINSHRKGLYYTTVLLVFAALGIALVLARGDIIERKRSEEIKEINSELTKRNLELEQFTHIAAHDLREPLKKLHTFCELLEKSASSALSIESKTYLERIKFNAKWMAQLIDDFRALTKIGYGRVEKEQCSLADIVRQVWSDRNSAVQKHSATLSLINLPTLWCYQRWIYLLFDNLIENALIHSMHDAPKIVISGEENKTHWIVTVFNDGKSILRNDAKKVFLPFKRLENDPNRGSGMGLTICQKVVERHRGTIWVDTSVPNGVAIKFTIAKEGL